MKKIRKKAHTIQNRKQAKIKFNMRLSQYSCLYRKYIFQEFASVETMIRKIVKMPFCQYYYLRYPLEQLMKGAVKKMLLNCYETLVFGYFLEQVQEWKIGTDVILNVGEVFPDIVHVNEPTDANELKQISMFLYFSSYSVKEFLNPSMNVYQEEMHKLFPEFEHLLIHWINKQSTVNTIINPKLLNAFAKKMQKNEGFVDYNTCVDKIIQISPCYDISGKGKQKNEPLPQFGYMECGPYQYVSENQGVKLEEMSNIDLMDFKFDGDAI